MGRLSASLAATLRLENSGHLRLTFTDNGKGLWLTLDANGLTIRDTGSQTARLAIARSLAMARGPGPEVPEPPTDFPWGMAVSADEWESTAVTEELSEERLARLPDEGKSFFEVPVPEMPTQVVMNAVPVVVGKSTKFAAGN